MNTLSKTYKVKRWKKALASYIFRSDIDYIKNRIDSILNTRMHNNVEIFNACVKSTTRLHACIKEYSLSDITIDKLVSDHIRRYERFRKNTIKNKELLEVMYKNSSIISSTFHELSMCKFIKQIEETLASYHKYIDSIVDSSENARRKLFF